MLTKMIKMLDALFDMIVATVFWKGGKVGIFLGSAVVGGGAKNQIKY